MPMSWAFTATIRPSRPRRRIAAARPKRVPSTQSNATGEPPRWRCPGCVTRVWNPVRFSISEAREIEQAARQVEEPVLVQGGSGSSGSPPSGRPPPRRRRSRTSSGSRAGDGGGRILCRDRTAARGSRSRPPGPPCRRRRRCSHVPTHHLDEHHAVVALRGRIRRSIASVATCTAVWKPNSHVGAPPEVDRLRDPDDRFHPFLQGAPLHQASLRRRSRRGRPGRVARASQVTFSRPSSGDEGFAPDDARIVPPRGDAGGFGDHSGWVASSRSYQPSWKPTNSIPWAGPAANDRADRRVQSGTMRACPDAEVCVGLPNSFAYPLDKMPMLAMFGFLGGSSSGCAMVSWSSRSPSSASSRRSIFGTPVERRVLGAGLPRPSGGWRCHQVGDRAAGSPGRLDRVPMNR